VRYAEVETRALLLANRDIVDTLVKALIEYGTLSGTEVDTVIAAGVAARSIAIERQRRDD
jgi:ATP-dependent Zn protease